MFIRQMMAYVLVIGASVSAWAASSDPIKYLPIQDSGRVKPYDSFARESLQLVYGKQTYNGRGATEVVTTWMLIPQHWKQEQFIQIRHSGLREALKLKDKRIYYSPEELMRNERLGLLMQELTTKRQANEKLDPYFQAIQKLSNQLNVFHAITLGQALRVVPSPDSDTWLSVAELTGELKERFQNITGAFVKDVVNSNQATSSQNLKQAVESFVSMARASAPDKYPDEARTNIEVHYNDFHPFQWSWILYLLAAIFLTFSWLGRSKLVKYYYATGWVFLVAGFLLHGYGMGLRVFLTGRPPVSNMYETVIWVAWGAILFAMILEWVYRYRFILVASTIVSVLCLIISDMAPAVLDSSLQPLEPVLRDNFWLLTHVLIITLSYAAFFLAFAIGDVMLVYYLLGEKKHAKSISNGSNAIYRAIQIGVVLLAAGTILGGVWADYSWGRFWGWDPKETWALIALLGYLAVLHGRLAGWVKNFGLALSSILAFSLVIMAWYGVNFVLGAGLHTYGFGAGGVEYVSAFVAIHLLFVVYVGTVRRSRIKTSN